MNASSRRIRWWAYTAGTLTVALGLFHDAMLSTQMPSVESLSRDYQDGFAWLFLCTGTAVAFAGAMCLIVAGGLVRGEPSVRRVTLASCLFLVVLGVVGVWLRQYGALSSVALAIACPVSWWRTGGAAAPPGDRGVLSAADGGSRHEVAPPTGGRETGGTS